MIKTLFGNKLCKISNAPFQGFRWKAGPQGRYKETIICFAVAQQKNVCQCCLNDMKYGLPVGVRDSLLTSNDHKIKAPESDVGATVFYAQQAQNLGENCQSSFSGDMSNVAASRQLDIFSKSTLYSNSAQSSSTAFRNLPKLCSFWLNGTCTRVARKVCPFRPCCGIFVFPELASSHRDLMNSLIEMLKSQGPSEMQGHIDAETKAAFRDSLKGNRDNSIKKRMHGDDTLTQKYLNKIKSGVCCEMYLT